MTLLLRLCGALTMAALLVLMVTGVLLSMHYVPLPEAAAASVRAIETDVVGGSAIRAVHHHATSMLVLAVVAWCALLAWEWRGDRRMWFAVTGLVVVAVVGAWTGRLLPDDHYAATSRSVMRFGLHEGHGGSIVGILLGLRSAGTSALATTYAMHAVVGALAGAGLLQWLRKRVAWTQMPEQWVMVVGTALVVAAAMAWAPVVPGSAGDVDPSRPWWMFLPLHHLANWFGAELTSIMLWALVGGVVSLPWWVDRVRPVMRRAAILGLAILMTGLLLA